MAERFKSRFSDAQAAFDAKPQETGNYIQDMITKSHHVERLIKAILDFVTNPLESNARIIYSAQTKQQYDAIRDELIQTLAKASEQTAKATNIIGRYAGVEPIKTERVFLRAFNNLFVSAKFHLKNELMADRELVEAWEIFDLFWLGENKIALRGFKKLFIQTNPDQNGALLANGPNIREWETFTIHYLEDGKIALQAFNGLFVSAKLHEQNQLVADREEVEGWETFNLLWV